MAGLAQLVEYQIVALGVTGSSPVARPKKLDKLLLSQLKKKISHE